MKRIFAVILLMFVAGCTSDGAQRFTGAYGGINGGGAGGTSTSRP